ncbi:dienelactone hydrolase family protein [Sphingobium sp. CAP-1]|uniref:dienelactone hydrolase family protein n=1 Tax=Sphingobium sp. CAP-1 TaxID=2676077 RepID=UPI0012BB251E|nr:dienelactone hydrolase family protein [Sphingobium sp. CAP-1]QGP81014.1 dienelactone hydrolase family protein [Sphingobium sp. CAP-1]
MRIITDEYSDIDVAAGATMRAHIFRPAPQGRYPALLLFSEIYQVTGPIRRLAAILAGHGFVVCAPEVYHEYEAPGSALSYTPEGTERGNMLKIQKPLDAFDRDARAAIDFLTAYPGATGAVGTIGLCLGGHLALRAAFDDRVGAAACFYPTDVHAGTLGAGRSDDTLARMDRLKAQSLFVWGRQDPHIPFAGREAIRARLEAVGANYEWLEFNAEHAFMRDEGPRYDPALASRAMTSALDLFHRAL